ncbi:MAG: cupin domain-containing protein [Woeseiaceae bacterium]|nr:cupin domain-containing protein [Woeseiaceae bacterium]
MRKIQQSFFRTVRSGRIASAALAAAIVIPLVMPLAAPAAEDAFTRTADSSAVEWGPCPAFMPEGCALAVLQGDPAKPGADALFKLLAHTTAPEHWHHSAERMVLLEGEMEVNYEGQAPVTLQEGTYAYGPPQLSHSATCTSDKDCILFIAFDQPVDAMAGASD